MTLDRPDEDALRAVRYVAIVGAIFSLTSMVGWGLFVGISVATGALFATVNLYAYARIVAAIFGPRAVEANPGASRVWSFVAFNKLLLIFGGTWLLMASGAVSPIGLALGYLALPIGIVVATLRR